MDPTNMCIWPQEEDMGLTTVPRGAKGGSCLLGTFVADPTNHPTEERPPQG